MSETERVLKLAAEIIRLQAIEKAARSVVEKWEGGLIIGREGYQSYCDLDMAILRDKLEVDPSTPQDADVNETEDILCGRKKGPSVSDAREGE